MQLKNSGAEIFVPDGIDVQSAVGRTTHLCISAHQDDIEIMAFHGVLQCFGSSDKWFGGVVVTNGAGSPRDGLYSSYTDEEMRTIRKLEQKKAAYVGEYSFAALLDFTSSEVKSAADRGPIEDIKQILNVAKPSVVYTHNPADKHDTHVGIMLKTIQAIRELPENERPDVVYGCEVWRDLDWMADSDKVALDCAGHENLAAALLGVFDSQICGGKRYDLATIGRRRAHATYHESHGTDATNQLIFAMDLTPLIKDVNLDVEEYIAGYVARLAADIQARLERLRK